MIHIDDLFRQRMGDRETSPANGAWSNMRALLDKEMPVTPATNWRRVFGYFTGLLLLASASVGGYSLYSGQLQSNLGTARAAMRASNTSLGAGFTSANPAAAASAEVLHNAASSPANAPKPQLASGSGPDGSIAAASTREQGSANAPISNTSSSSAGTVVNKISVGSKTSGSGSGSDAALASVRQAARVAPSPSGDQLGSASAESGSGTADALASKAIAARNQSPASGASPDSRNSRRANRTGSGLFAATESTNPRPEIVPASATKRGSNGGSTNSNAIADGLNSRNSGPLVTNPQPITRRVLDTIQRIEILTRKFYAPGCRRPSYRLDTLPTEYVVIARNISLLPAVAPDEQRTTSNGNESGDKSRKSRAGKRKTGPSESFAAAPPAAKAPITPDPASEGGSGTPSSTTSTDLAAKLSGNKLSFWQSLRLDEKVQQAKATLQSVELYPGMIAGLNATMFTPNVLGGFQLGLTSLIAINDNWSVLGELKYIHRFNAGSSLADDYTKVTESRVTPIGTTQLRYDWNEEKVSHYFNYEAIQTIEVPLAIRYNNNRFFAQTGLNFVSSRPIAAREVTNPSGTTTQTNRTVPASWGPDKTPLPTDTEPTVKISDFGNRLGVGYVFGAGYMFTPAVYFDFRMTQTFLNNANTVGSRQIARDLLGRPSFQLSVGYRLGTSSDKR